MFAQKEEYNKWAAYAQSKTANILFSAALAERWGDRGVFSYAAEVGGGRVRPLEVKFNVH